MLLMPVIVALINGVVMELLMDVVLAIRSSNASFGLLIK